MTPLFIVICWDVQLLPGHTNLIMLFIDPGYELWINIYTLLPSITALPDIATGDIVEIPADCETKDAAYTPTRKPRSAATVIIATIDSVPITSSAISAPL